MTTVSIIGCVTNVVLLLHMDEDKEKRDGGYMFFFDKLTNIVNCTSRLRIYFRTGYTQKF